VRNVFIGTAVKALALAIRAQSARAAARTICECAGALRSVDLSHLAALAETLPADQRARWRRIDAAVRELVDSVTSAGELEEAGDDDGS
jgi:hypothetical protein